MDNTRTVTTLREAALHIAQSYIGQEEVPRGSNAGPFVEDCLRRVGLGKGNAWCQAFAYRVYAEAATGIGYKNPMPKTAGVLDCRNKAKAAGHTIILKKNANLANIPPGAQAIYDHGSGLGHTMLVQSWLDADIFTSIEGNTDPAGSRNGYGVFARKRSRRDAQLVCFIVYNETSTA